MQKKLQLASYIRMTLIKSVGYGFVFGLCYRTKGVGNK